MAAIDLMSLTYTFPKQFYNEFTPVKSKLSNDFTPTIHIRRLFYIFQEFKNAGMFLVTKEV